MPFDDQARRDRRPRRRGARRDPVRPGVRRDRGRGLLRRGAGRAARRQEGLGRRELPLRSQGARATRDARRRATSSRPASCRWSRSTARRCPRPGSAPWSRPARSTRRRRCLGAPFMIEGRWWRATSAAARSASRPRTSFPTTPGRARARRLRRVRQRAPGGGQRRRAADVRDRARAADRGVPDRLRGRPLRAAPCGSLSSSGCAASGASRASRS